ncbi:MAG: hypothetical protein HC900_01185 [Methylacidiphilales bacterium]|nr:hypothetical protein [Candidatus Methylacidiphilales bacterium]
MPTKKQLEEADRLLKTFDWSKVDAMTDAEIIAAAKADPDSSLPTDEELAEFDLVIPAKARREMAAAKDAAKQKAEAAAGDEPAKPKDAAE